LRAVRRKLGSLGFTLIELLVVVGVITILAGTAIVGLRGAREGAITARTMNFANSVRTQLILGEVGNWNFDSSALGTGGITDSSGLNNHGTLHLGTADNTTLADAQADGVVRRALSFDGQDDFVTIRDVDWFDGRRPWTISFWMNSGAFRPTWDWIISDETTTQEPMIIVRRADGNIIHLALRQAGGAWIMYVKIPFTPNAWHHIIFTYNGTELIGYRDGAFIGRTSSTLTPGFSTRNLEFGRRSGGGGHWNGLLDEVQIYNEALRAGEVQMRYAQGLEGLLARGMISQEEFEQRMNNFQQLTTDN